LSKNRTETLSLQKRALDMPKRIKRAAGGGSVIVLIKFLEFYLLP
jgi:hypothetical protein